MLLLGGRRLIRQHRCAYRSESLLTVYVTCFSFAVSSLIHVQWLLLWVFIICQPSSVCLIDWFSPLVWTLACRGMDSWNTGTHHPGSTEVINFCINIKPMSWKILLITYANSEGSGEPAHPCSLNRAITVRTPNTGLYADFWKVGCKFNGFYKGRCES